jgi:hypothetical protein
MRVRLESLANVLSHQTFVSFASTIGRAHGRWVGPRPEIKSEYEVELEIPGPLRWGEQINVTEQMIPAVFEQGGDTFLIGTLQRFDGTVAEVTLADSVMLVELDRVACTMPCQVVIRTRDLQLFDANV